MDEASRLVLELQAKLTELDSKVFKYQQEMATAFTIYKDNLLRDVPKDVSDTVTRVMSAEIHNHPYLQPVMSIDSSASTGSSSLVARLEQNAPDLGLSPGIGSQQHTPELQDQMERGPHDRELEFRGVFTPGYLPLLDGSDAYSSSSSSQHLSHAIEIKARGKETEHLGTDASTGTTRSLAASPEFSRPLPKRKNTDEVSFMTDTSDGFPRSALRRSSSSSNKPQSPRHVRFNIVTAEVLPTSSPLPHEAVFSTSIPNSSDGHEDPDEEYHEAEDSEAEEESTSSFLLGDGQDSPPRKKKMSSTARLRALSRAPLEDTTEWTTVTGGPDDMSTRQQLGLIGEEDSDDDNPVTYSHIEEVKEQYLGKSLEEQAEEAGGTVDPDSSSEDEMVIKPKKRIIKPSVTPLSIINSSNPKQTPSSPTSHGKSSLNHDRDEKEVKMTTVVTKPKDDRKTEVEEGVDDGYELPFDLEDFDENATPSRSPLPNIKEDLDAEASDHESPVESTEPYDPIPDIKRTEFGTPIRAPVRTIGSLSSPVSMGAAGGVGSYKGHPIKMQIVNDDIHTMAASLGNIQSYVGSMSGRTGVDESNPQSFKESFGGSGSASRSSFSGTPKSFSERMAMENLLEDSENEENGA